MSKGHLKRIQNRGQGLCARCSSNFKENDIIATSTSQRYCYTCATKINLVTGDINKDLNKEEFVSHILDEITKIAKSIYVPDHITRLAKIIIKTTFENAYHVSRNKKGLASAAIYLAYKIEFEENPCIEKLLPVSKKMLEMNSDLLKKSMNQISPYMMANMIHGVMQ